jgi:hypothetical protein
LNQKERNNLFFFFTPYKILWIQQHIDIARMGRHQLNSSKLKLVLVLHRCVP